MTDTVALGIETSCDETAVGVVAVSDKSVKVLASKVSTQVDLHAAYGGVVPELASREHVRNLPLVLDEALKEASIDVSDVECIGVTSGPGLKGCLLVGCMFAQGLSLRAGIPLLGINHLEGHILSGFLNDPSLSFPFIALIVSGGHTEIHIVKGLGDYERVSRTLDDAAGEAFDKSASLLGFGYPGGPQLAACGDSVSESRYSFTVPMQGSRDFSFSGLKTSISLQIQSVKKDVALTEWPQHRAELAFSVQKTVVSTLVQKVARVVAETGITEVVACGGVAANGCLRRNLQELRGVTPHFVELRFCTDNGAMIAYSAAQRWRHGVRPQGTLTIRSRWPVTDEVSKIFC